MPEKSVQSFVKDALGISIDMVMMINLCLIMRIIHKSLIIVLLALDKLPVLVCLALEGLDIYYFDIVN